eukprot:1162036-Pelagomonas_calceolata.AAC.7
MSPQGDAGLAKNEFLFHALWLQSNMPSSLRSPEAMARKLRTEISRITLVCAATAAGGLVGAHCMPPAGCPDTKHGGGQAACTQVHTVTSMPS